MEVTGLVRPSVAGSNLSLLICAKCRTLQAKKKGRATVLLVFPHTTDCLLQPSVRSRRQALSLATANLIQLFFKHWMDIDLDPAAAIVTRRIRLVTGICRTCRSVLDPGLPCSTISCSRAEAPAGIVRASCDNRPPRRRPENAHIARAIQALCAHA